MSNAHQASQVVVALVTGATGAIGKAIARLVAQQAEYEVVLVARDAQKAERAVEDIVRVTGNSKVHYELADLSRQADVQALAEGWQGPLHVLVNNAATTPRSRHETPEGIELQFATNVLGYFWMTLAFADHLKQSAPSRIVNVASYWAGDLDLNDLEFARRGYRNGQAYRQSKQANRMLTVAFAERLREHGVSVNACHPGDVSSQLSNNLGFGGHATPDEGAQTPVWLATTPIGQQETGKYFERMRQVPCPFSQNTEAIENLYQACLSYTD
jgi:NAD(P)-dependent dehydrogenase (short-subunit alcohol dehydrogenase family)